MTPKYWSLTDDENSYGIHHSERHIPIFLLMSAPLLLDCKRWSRVPLLANIADGIPAHARSIPLLFPLLHTSVSKRRPFLSRGCTWARAAQVLDAAQEHGAAQEQRHVDRAVHPPPAVRDTCGARPTPARDVLGGHGHAHGQVLAGVTHGVQHELC